MILMKKMKSIMIKIKHKFICDHTYEPIYFDENECLGIRYYVCSKCGHVVFSTK